MTLTKHFNSIFLSIQTLNASVRALHSISISHFRERKVVPVPDLEDGGCEGKMAEAVQVVLSFLTLSVSYWSQTKGF